MDQARYNLIKRNQATMRKVNDILRAEASSAIAGATGLSNQEMGGFLRTLVPGLIDSYGNVNASAAKTYYEEQRAAWVAGYNRAPTFSASRNRSIRKGQNRAAERRATAQLRGQLYVARIPAINVLERSEPVIGYGMSLYAKAGLDGMTPELVNAMTREVAMYNRDTLLYNSTLDKSVAGVQRVAEPNACSFCQTVAFGSDGNPRVGSYAPEFHNNCNCTIETLFEGDTVFQPDYYKDFKYGNENPEELVVTGERSTSQTFS